MREFYDCYGGSESAEICKDSIIEPIATKEKLDG